MVKPVWVKGSESALIERLRRNDTRAWRSFNDSHKVKVFGYCLRMLRDRAEAEDVCQEVFLRAARAIGDFRGDSSLGTWLRHIAANLCRSRFGSRGERTTVDESWIADLPDEAPDPERALVNRELRAALERAIGQLEPDFREAVILRDVQDLPYGEIAEITGVEVGTVKTRIHRGRKALQALLADYRP